MPNDDASPKPAGDGSASPTFVMIAALAIGLVLIGTYFILALRYFNQPSLAVLGIPSSATPRPLDAALARLPWVSLIALLVSMGSGLAILLLRAIGMAMTALFSLSFVLIGVFSIGTLPSLLVLTHLVFGVLFGLFGWLLFAQRNRGAWAGLVAMSGVVAGVQLFGSTSTAKLFGVSIWIGLIPFALFVVGTVALRGCEPREVHAPT